MHRLFLVTFAVASFAQSQRDPQAAAHYAAADIRVQAVGIIYNSGLVDLADAYMKQTGKKIEIQMGIMGAAMNTIKTGNPPADIVMLPLDQMGTLSIEDGILPGTFFPLGRAQMGLAVRAGAPHPDISTVEKLAVALRSAKQVMRSNPAHGSLVAKVIEDQVIKRPEFSGVHSVISLNGEGGQALARGEGDMAIQAICEILPHKEIELVGPLPRELGAWIDMAIAVNARSEHPEAARAFLNYLLRPAAKPIWTAKGLDRFN